MRELGTQYHMGIHRRLVAGIIERDRTADRILVGWTGTVKEALEALRNGPEYLFCEECDNRNPDGTCAGHPMAAEEPIASQT